ncbi:MAG: hypothetical protein JXB46_11490, partial [Candidatus Eisenbacteria bacterium]|nr:hypothetical protein [Candidatus Eisenbacteria bacterium]
AKEWPDNPYAGLRGGPCARSYEFFTDAEAADWYRKRLDYLSARYACYSNLFAWELFNEVNLVDGYWPDEAADWHARMAGYLRGIDPYDHLITTSFSGPTGSHEIWGLPGIDFVQAHDYGEVDWGANSAKWARQLRRRYGKPMLFGEIGILHDGRRTRTADPQGVHLHNGLWGAVMGGGAGTGMTWWWDSYVHPADLYHHFGSVSRFAGGVDWTQGFRELDGVRAEFAPGTAATSYGAVEISTDNESWDPAPFNEPVTLVVDRAGRPDRPSLLSRTLHGTVNHPELHNPQTFLLDCPASAEFEVSIEGVSGWGGANLAVIVDGEERLRLHFPDADRWTETIHEYDERHTVLLGPGSHEITVVNDGVDWVTVSYVVRNEWAIEEPPVRCIGLAGPDDVLVWVQNRAFTLKSVRELKCEPGRIERARLVLPLPAPASYRVQVWDTWAGREVGRGRVRGGPAVAIRLPDFTQALALRISRVPDR